MTRILVLTALLTAHVSLAQLQNPLMSVTVPHSPWVSQGCFVDSIEKRTLSGPSFKDTTYMSVGVCRSFCAARALPYSGVEYGVECFCASSFNPTGLVADIDDCNMPCAGDATDVCGAADRVQVSYYTDEFKPAHTPKYVGDHKRWEYTGCFADSIDKRVLTDGPGLGTYVPEGITITECTGICQNLNFKYAGLEYSRGCGNSIGDATKTADNQCDLRCEGKNDELCGGADRITIYKDTSDEDMDHNVC
ncbi:unnamed protein product [Mycena citricolor]|uniref:WSC domain-containing protein n=1 Tax=Mycena citricolor TaxID=2018698 RepID=A0AAD2H8I5_9AGAR|nr:unnamed protein product [Mycena citricolor]